LPGPGVGVGGEVSLPGEHPIMNMMKKVKIPTRRKFIEQVFMILLLAQAAAE
jgi:hypothetical protein